MKPSQPTPSTARTQQARRLQDLRGATRLATEATLAVTSLAEALHARMASVPGLRGPEQTRGITRLVYRTVGAITSRVGAGLDQALAALTPLLLGPAEGRSQAKASDSNRHRDTIVAALNGVLGDHLAATHNPLAITAAFHYKGHALTLEPAALHEALAPSTGSLLVLLHGLCMHPQQWCRDGHDHGAALAQAGGYTPLYWHYNTGLPLHLNGQAFAQQMQTLLAQWPQPLQRVVLLGHSMGGLVARSALHQAQQAGQSWARQVDDAVFLGSPHHGAPLERAGTWVDLILGGAPYAAPLAQLTRLRSAGIQSLGRADLLGLGGRSLPDPTPLPSTLRCYAVAGTIGAATHGMHQRLWGDGLVPLASALGQHPDPARCLKFAPERQLHVPQTHHMALLSSPAVADALLSWLT